MRKVALLIGVSEYGEGIPALSAPPNDVKAMKRVLENPEMGGFEVQTLINPDTIEMRKAIRELFRAEQCQKDDLILLFFSGHGITDDNNKLYLATPQTSDKDFEATGVDATFIHNQLYCSYAKRQVIILDCCYSGAFAGGWQTKSVGVDLSKELGAEGRVVLTSSSATQTSFQHENSLLSVYTQYLVEGIETGAADTDGDGKIHIQELHNYAKKKVREVKPKTEPTIILDKEGYNILLAKAPINNPELKFRQEVEKRAKDGEISKRVRDILKTKQRELQLSDEQAEEIISSVLKPYQLYRESLKRYEEEYRQEVLNNYPLDEDIAKELEEWASVHLCLRDADVEIVQQRIISKLNKTISQDLKPIIPLPTQKAIELISPESTVIWS